MQTFTSDSNANLEIASLPQAIKLQRVPLDKSEGGVKDKSILSVFLAPLFCQRG
jgi:hypothetical protein